ncbi:MAG: DNA internalization-related competence protein ComEC/Rec2 [Syntrophobacteraceae bacterium]|nr:DNA internalization-related competence protein ComEC/Rec2 [Syntrophobacteraceae bacterium]
MAGVTLGLVISGSTPPRILVMVSAGSGLLVLALGFLHRLQVLRSPIAGMVSFGILGMLTGQLAAATLPAPSSLTRCFESPPTLYLAEVASPATFQEERARIPIRLISALGPDRDRPVDADVLLTIGRVSETSPRWLPGDRFLARLTVRPIRGLNNPGGFDYVKYQAERGIHGRAYLPDDRSLLRVREPLPADTFPGRFVSGVSSGFEAFRQDARWWLQKSLAPDVADFYGALLLGYSLPPKWSDHLNRTGLSHLLSISGLHLGLVGLGVFWLSCLALRWLAPGLLQRVSDQQIARWPALLAVAAYAMLSGLAIPTWRSLIMFALLTWAVLRFRLPDAMSTLALAACTILLAWPHSIGQPSFQLSFGAMVGIFVLYPRIASRVFKGGCSFAAEAGLAGRLLKPFAEAFWVSLAVNLMILPILIHHFHGVSLAGFIANTLLVPVVGLVVLPMGLAGLVLLTVQETLALWIFQVGAWVVEACLWVILRLSGLSWAYFWVGAPSLAAVAAYYSGLAILQFRWALRKKIVILTGLTLVAVMAQLIPLEAGDWDDAAKLRVHIIDVGQGLSTLLRFPSGETMLVDGGGFYDDSFDLGRATLAPFLWQAGIHHLDHVVLSHDHPDHRNGLKFILSHFTVGCFWETGLAIGGEDGSRLAVIARQRGIPIRRGQEILGRHSLGGCGVSVLHPTPDFLDRSWDAEDLNNASIVLEVTYGITRLLLPGDIDQALENRLPLASPDGLQTLLVAAHHGSDRSTGPILLERLRPGAAFFSCGQDNVFGFPSPAVLARCRDRGIAVYRTDRHGAIEAVSNGSGWEIKTQVQGPTPWE